jgi:hypothetical protein
VAANVAMRKIAEPHHASVVVFKQLSEEFGDRIDSGTIRRVASEEVALFDGAKVRDFIPMIAWRLARARLKDLLAGR